MTLTDNEKLDQIEKVIEWALKDSAFLYVHIREQLRRRHEFKNSDKEILKEIEKIIDQPRFSQSWRDEIKEILEGLQGSYVDEDDDEED